jgi:hypothetical protein
MASYEARGQYTKQRRHYSRRVDGVPHSVSGTTREILHPADAGLRMTAFGKLVFVQEVSKFLTFSATQRSATPWNFCRGSGFIYIG